MLSLRTRAPVLPIALAFGSLTLFVLALPAFWPAYLSKPLAPDRYTHFHAAVGALWLALLIAQPALIALRRSDVHRAVGRAAFALAPLFVLSAILLAHFRFSRMDTATFAAEAYTLYLPLSAALLFGAAFALAMRFRRVASLHARFMACTALVLVDPVVGRVLAFHVIELAQFWHYQLITFALEAAILAALALSLARGSAARRIFGAFAAAYLSVLGLWFTVPRTALWHDFAGWFRQLQLT